MRAVFFLTPPTHGYFLATAGALCGIRHIWLGISVPPFHAAGIRTKASATALAYINRFPALRTAGRFTLFVRDILSAAVGFDRVLRYTELFCYFYIAIASKPHLINQAFLLICHEVSSSPRTLVLTTHWKKRSPSYKKIKPTREKSQAGFTDGWVYSVSTRYDGIVAFCFNWKKPAKKSLDGLSSIPDNQSIQR
jgi:hypothetical protein